jgi:hypothetical protein
MIELRCPFCDKPMDQVNDNLAFWTWSCAGPDCGPAGVFLYRAKPRQATWPDTGKLVNLGAVALSVVNEEGRK